MTVLARSAPTADVTADVAGRPYIAPPLQVWGIAACGSSDRRDFVMDRPIRIRRAIGLLVAAIVLLAPLALPALAQTQPSQAFVHPGIPLSKADLDAIKANLDNEPWKSGFKALASSPQSQLDYRMRGPCKEVTRPRPYTNNGAWRSDMTAIYNLSRMWYFTGNEAYARKAHDILLAWATTHEVFSGREASLDMGDFAHCFVGGADILRGTWPGWTAADTETVKRYFENVYWRACVGDMEILGPANKGALALAAAGAVAVFNDDQQKLDRVLHLFRTQPATGLTNTLPTGQIGESGRDQGHAHGTILSMAFLAEILWKQGIDVYSDMDNRLLAVGEYFARNNYGVLAPYVPFSSIDAQYNVAAGDAGKGWQHGRRALNILYGAYVLRKGLPAPYLELQRSTLPLDADSFVYEKPADASTATPLPPVPTPPLACVTAGLSDLDIAAAAPAGNSSYRDGVWTVRGGGSEIWGPGADSCHFTYEELAGDCTIIAKVESLEQTSPNATAGVMLRDSLKPDALSAFAALTPERKFTVCMTGWTPGGVWGGSNRDKYVRDLPEGYGSYWFKIERRGSLVTAFTSPDGSSWGTSVVAQFNDLGRTTFVGLVVCSNNNGTPNTATFSNVQITGGNGAGPATVPPAPLALCASPGHGCVPLRWSGVFGASRYHVKRSTARGTGYTTIASVTGNGYTDTGVTNGTTYHYVVSAVNTAGESGNSPEDAATPMAAMVNLATGGMATAFAQSDQAAQAFDLNSGTKWFAGPNTGSGWLQYDLGAGRAAALRQYALTSAADAPERDPRNWAFQGSNDASTWTTLDTQSDQRFAKRYQTLVYPLAGAKAYRYYRLNIAAENEEKAFQVAELSLLAEKSGSR